MQLSLVIAPTLTRHSEDIKVLHTVHISAKQHASVSQQKQKQQVLLGTCTCSSLESVSVSPVLSSLCADKLSAEFYAD